MISARKIRTLKPRVQLRRAADAFHEAAASDPGREYLDEVMDIIRASDVLDAEDKEKILARQKAEAEAEVEATEAVEAEAETAEAAEE